MEMHIFVPSEPNNFADAAASVAQQLTPPQSSVRTLGPRQEGHAAPTVEEERNERANLDETRDNFTMLIINQFAFVAMSLTAYLHTNDAYSLTAIGAITVLIFLARMFFRCFARERRNEISLNKTRYILSLLVAFVEASAALLFVLWNLSFNVPPETIIPLLLASLVLRNVEYCFYGSRLTCVRLDDMVQVYLYSFLTIQVALYILRVADVISWPWSNVFILFWVLLAVWGILSAVLIIYVLKQLLFLILEIFDALVFKGVFWSAAVSSGYLIISTFVVVTTIKYYEEDKYFEIMLKVTKGAALVITPMTLVLTLHLRTSLIKYFSRLQIDGADDDYAGEERVSSFRREPMDQARKNLRPRSQAKIVAHPMSLPVFLKKISSAYFREMTPHFHRDSYSPTAKAREAERADTIKLSFESMSERQEKELASSSKGNESPMSQQSEAPGNCIICLTNGANGVIRPCGHGGLCIECAIELFQLRKGCHLCRKEIQSVLKIAGEPTDKVVKVESQFELEDSTPKSSSP